METENKVTKEEITRVINHILNEVKVNGKFTIQGVGQFYTTVQKGREGVSKMGGVEKAWKTEDKVVLKFYQNKALDVSDYKVN